MWIIRINKITTKHYNQIKRAFNKIWFYPRSIAPIIFIKALLYNYLEKRSWRNIAWKLNCNYIALYNFYTNYNKKEEIYKIFHTFVEDRIIVFIGENKSFSYDDLNNSDKYLKLTLNELNNIFKE